MKNYFIFIFSITLFCIPQIYAQNFPETNSSPVAMVDTPTPLELEQADLAINLAHSLAREKKFRAALQEYREFVRVFSHSPRVREAHENMARIYEREQRFDLAIREYETLYRILSVSPLGLLYHLEAARLHEIEGNIDTALAIYKELNRIDSGSDAARKARVRMENLSLMQKVGDQKKTSDLAADQLVKSSPQNE